MSATNDPIHPERDDYERAWAALRAEAGRMAARSILSLFEEDQDRLASHTVEAAGIHADFSKQRIDRLTLERLLALARASDFDLWREGLFSGETVNPSEGRPALHPLLRAQAGDHGPEALLSEVIAERARMLDFVRGLLAGRPFTTVVNLGIGGSDLGPRMITAALGDRADRPEVRFAANADPAELARCLHDLSPARTLFIIASKTFTTVETLDNARRARAWIEHAGLDAAGHFAAVTARADAAIRWGVPRDRVFSMHEGVGGRYSLWSSVGLPAAIGIGPERFTRLLEGARRMDAHFRTAPAESNLPLRVALVHVWNAAFLGARGRALVAYSDALRGLPAWMSQLEMESLGKRVDRDGRALPFPGAPLLVGGVGTVSQHSFHQMLHQGTDTIPTEFVVPLALPGDTASHRIRVTLAIAQAAALLAGTPAGTPAHEACPGDRPSTFVTLADLSPETLGALLACYEHATFCAGLLWRINPFDQWGVELGKRIARDMDLGETAGLDPSSAALLARAGLT